MTTSRVEKRPRFGELLREFRLAAGLSQEVLAERAAMSVNGISALERGTSQAPQRETLCLLVEALRLNQEQKSALEQAVVRPSKPRNLLQRPRDNYDLPRALTPFLGREQDIRAVTALVKETQLVTITGSGGVGKTRLALRIAEELLGAFHDGVRFVDFAPIRDPESVYTVVGGHFGVTQSEEGPILEKLTSSLQRKNALLIMDNCEHLVGAVASMSQALITACPELRIIATSRQSLNVPGEHIYRVTPLEPDSAVELFIERAKRALGSFAISDEDADSIARIVRRLDGIPLAIELAAARMNLLTLDQIEARLSERFHVLSGGSTVMLPRHQTMRTALDWSYDLLSSDEQNMFRWLWVFPSSFSMDAAVAICPDEQFDELRVFDVLASLVDKSLVLSEPAGRVQRYRLLDTVRAYAAERLHDLGEIEQLQSRHAEYYVALAESAVRTLSSADSTTAWARSLEPETENFQSALDWMLTSHGDVLEGAELLSNLQEFWITQGLAMQAARRAQATVLGTPDLPNTVRASLWLTIARMRQELFLHPQEMLEAACNARELYESVNDRSGLALALRQQAAAQMRLAAYPEAQANFERSIELYKELGDERMVVRGLGYLASLLLVQREYARARATLCDVLETSQNSGDDRMIPTVLVNLAEADFALGDFERAAERGRENLAHMETHKSIDMRACQEANLSAYLLALGRTDEARAMALDSAQDAVESFVAVPLQHLAAIIADTNPERAAILLGYVERVFQANAFTREHTERYTYDRLIATLKERLAEPTLAECMREGAAMSEKRVRKLAHQELR